MPSEVAVASKSAQDSSLWHQLGEIGVRALIGIVQEVANRAAPQIVDYLTNVPGTGPATSSADKSENGVNVDRPTFHATPIVASV
jgi:hypothetical protein